jgi:hypothetical protein
MNHLSAAYTGTVVHARQRPSSHRLRYRVFYLLLDLGQLPALDREFRLFAYNRPGVFSFHDADHGAHDGSNPLDWAKFQLRNAGITIKGGRIELLCMPRILGYVFNPLSIYYCFDHDEKLVAILYQVSNTFGESHTYLVPVRGEACCVLHHGFDKKLHVSPFIPMACHYDITMRLPGRDTSIIIRETDAQGPLLAATFHGVRRKLDDKFLASTLIKFPLLTLKVIMGIHWEALKLWLKRTPVFHQPTRPEHSVTVVTGDARVRRTSGRAEFSPASSDRKTGAET